jgi:hypothetical protein
MPNSPLLVTPQHTMDAGSLSRVPQFEYMPRNSLLNCSPPAASTGFTRELNTGAPKPVTASAHWLNWSKPQHRAERLGRRPHVCAPPAKIAA